MSHTSGEAETWGGGMLGWGEMQGETKGGEGGWQDVGGETAR